MNRASYQYTGGLGTRPVTAPAPGTPPSEASRGARLGRIVAGTAVVVAVLGLQAAAIHRQSLSGDGAQHLLAGQHALLHGQNLHNLEHPPLVKMVAALPVLATGEPLAPPVLPREAVPATDRMHGDGERSGGPRWQAAGPCWLSSERRC